MIEDRADIPTDLFRGRPSSTRKRGKHSYGCLPDQPDQRDFKLHMHLPLATPAPVKYGMTPMPIAVFNQGDLGSCTGNAISGAVMTKLALMNYPYKFTPSRLFVYYNERAMENTLLEDAGASLRDGFKSINQLGVCPEDSNIDWSWPYCSDQITFRLRPPHACYNDALLHKCLTYMAVPQDRDSIKSALCAGYPVVIGISVYDSFEGEQASATGIIPIPQSNESLLGGHALYLWGYGNKDVDLADGRNSWGAQWGDGGNFHIPWEYLENPDLCSDIWALEIISS